jgi:hypothetical protein
MYLHRTYARPKVFYTCYAIFGATHETTEVNYQSDYQSCIWKMDISPSCPDVPLRSSTLTYQLKIGALHIDAPQQNGQITVRAKMHITRSKYSFEGGISIMCATKPPSSQAKWDVVHHNRMSINQFNRGAASTTTTIPLTYVHTIGSTCASGTHTIRCVLFGLKKLTDEPNINANTGCPDISKLACRNTNSCMGSIDMLETTFVCKESMYSTRKSKALPVPPRSILQYQKIGFALSGNSVAPSFEVKNQNGLKNKLESLKGVQKVKLSKFIPGSDVF